VTSAAFAAPGTSDVEVEVEVVDVVGTDREMPFTYVVVASIERVNDDSR